MEYFTFFSIIEQIAVLFIPETDDLYLYVENYRRVLLLSLGVGLAIYLALLILGGLGLRKMAKRAGKKHSWMAFIPFLNTWYAGYIAGETRFFGQKMKRAGLYAAICEGFDALGSLHSIIGSFLLVHYPTVTTRPNDITQELERVVTYDVDKLPAAWQWLFTQTAQLWITVVGIVIGIMLLVFMYALFLALFRKYYARSPMLMTFISALLPFRGPVLFAVRNNEPVDYEAYMRRRMEEIARRQYGPMGPYGQNGPYNQGGYGPYGQNGPYNQGGYGPYGQGGYNQGPYDQNANGGSRPDEPFSDFGGNNGSDGNNSSSDSSSDNPFSGF